MQLDLITSKTESIFKKAKMAAKKAIADAAATAAIVDDKATDNVWTQCRHLLR